MTHTGEFPARYVCNGCKQVGQHFRKDCPINPPRDNNGNRCGAMRAASESMSQKGLLDPPRNRPIPQLMSLTFSPAIMSKFPTRFEFAHLPEQSIGPPVSLQPPSSNIPRPRYWVRNPRYMIRRIIIETPGSSRGKNKSPEKPIRPVTPVSTISNVHKPTQRPSSCKDVAEIRDLQISRISEAKPVAIVMSTAAPNVVKYNARKAMTWAIAPKPVTPNYLNSSKCPCNVCHDTVRDGQVNWRPKSN